MQALACSVTDGTTDLYTDVAEVTVRVKNTRLRIIRSLSGMGDARVYAHNVLRVTMNNGETYALDMTGAQFGWYGSTVMPWATFCDERVELIKNVRKFGETARVMKAEAKEAGWIRILIHKINEYIAEGFGRQLRQWKEHNGSFKAVLRWSQDEFQAKQDTLFGFMDDSMPIFRVMSKEKGLFDIPAGMP